MVLKFCVCTEQADGYGYSMAILAKFDTKEEAEWCINNGSAEVIGYASFYYIKEIWFRT